MHDSYQSFLKKFNIAEDKLIEFGLEESKFIDEFKAVEEWERLKDRIHLNQKVYVRTYGNRDNKTTKQILLDFYKEIYPDLEVATDGTGNYQPKRVLERLTEKKNKKDIVNFQVSHIFERTKNIYAFTAPWNFVYLPKIMDPLTGHEAHGDLKDSFRIALQKKSYDKYKDLIDDFNKIMDDLSSQRIKALGKLGNSKFKQEIEKDFEPIIV